MQSAEADLAADDLLDHGWRLGCRSLGINGREQQMCSHRKRLVGQRHERPEVAGRQRRAVGLDARQAEMAVDPGPAMPGQVLDHRQDAARKKAGAGRVAQRRHDLRIRREGAVANGVGGFGPTHVEYRGHNPR